MSSRATDPTDAPATPVSANTPSTESSSNSVTLLPTVRPPIEAKFLHAYRLSNDRSYYRAEVNSQNHQTGTGEIRDSTGFQSLRPKRDISGLHATESLLLIDDGTDVPKTILITQWRFANEAYATEMTYNESDKDWDWKYSEPNSSAPGLLKLPPPGKVMELSKEITAEKKKPNPRGKRSEYEKDDPNKTDQKTVSGDTYHGGIEASLITNTTLLTETDPVTTALRAIKQKTGYHSENVKSGPEMIHWMGSGNVIPGDGDFAKGYMIFKMSVDQPLKIASTDLGHDEYAAATGLPPMSKGAYEMQRILVPLESLPGLMRTYQEKGIGLEGSLSTAGTAFGNIAGHFGKDTISFIDSWPKNPELSLPPGQPAESVGDTDAESDVGSEAVVSEA